jgi:hypothetical protein
MKLFKYVDGIDSYDEWLPINRAWYKNEAPEGTWNLRDMAGQEFDEYMVPVEPTHRICTLHYGLADSHDANECLRQHLYRSDCEWVDVVAVTP